MRKNPRKDLTRQANDLREMPPELRELLQYPAFREVFLEVLAFFKNRRSEPTSSAADLARTRKKAADLCERFLHASIMARLPQLTEGLPPEERSAAEERLGTLASRWRRDQT